MQNDNREKMLDLACLILAQIIEQVGFRKCSEHAVNFFRALTEMQTHGKISTMAYSSTLCILVKTN